MCGVCFVVLWVVVVWFYGVGVLGFGVGLVLSSLMVLASFFQCVRMAVARQFHD
jgi:hypothetical protein